MPAGKLAGAVTVTVIASDAVQQSVPKGEIWSQDPPVPVAARALKLKPVLVVATVTICGKGSAPPAGMVKRRGFTWLKTGSPITTLIGMLTLPTAVSMRTSPTKVPATNPPPGRLAGKMDTASIEAAVP